MINPGCQQNVKKMEVLYIDKLGQCLWNFLSLYESNNVYWVQDFEHIFKVIIFLRFLKDNLKNGYYIILYVFEPYFSSEMVKLMSVRLQNLAVNQNFLPIFSRVSSECLVWDTWSSAASEFPLHLGICLHSHPGCFLSSTIKRTSSLELFWAPLLVYTR